MHEIRQRALSKRTSTVDDKGLLSSNSGSLTKLKDLLLDLQAVCARLEDSPPQPPTVRGRVGGFLAKIVRRAMFWQYMQAKTFSNTVTSVLAELYTAADESVQANRALLESAAAAQDNAATGISVAHSLETRIARLEAITSDQCTRADDLQSRTFAVESALSELNDRFTHVQMAVDNTLSELDGRRTHAQMAVESALSELNDRFTHVQMTVENTLSELDGRRTHAQMAVESALSELSGRLTHVQTTAESTLSELHDRLTHVQMTVESALSELNDRRTHAQMTVESVLSELSGRLTHVQTTVESTLSALNDRLTQLQMAVEDQRPLTEAASRIEKRLAELDRYARQTRRDATLQATRISALSRRMQESINCSNSSLIKETAEVNTGAMDALYLGFEDVYRGDPGEIRDRLSAYLPVLKEYEVQPALGPAVDVGCGRGEWLDLLASAGFQAKGCDINIDMVNLCRERGLDVELRSGIGYLRSIPPGSLAIVSAIHVIEHQPLDTLLGLLDASIVALKAGGILILESPNPQNLLVGCHNFYLDPTHQRPLPMQLTQFLVESRGFCDIRAFGLHPYPASFCLEESSQVAQRFNEYFYGPQDYAVVGRRI